MAEKVVVGMSGGVDSSVAAYLLKKQGYDVVGVTMSVWSDDESETVENDAKRVAEKLDIPHYVLNFKNEFEISVIDYFVREYLKGVTPNPCIVCNRYVKWESLLTKSLQIGGNFIATGHYARIVRHPITGRYTLKTAETDTKDQTYALYNLTQYQLSHTLMPIGEYDKNDIRKIAAEIGLFVADKPDSQDICFIKDNDYAAFIKERCGDIIEKGNFIDFDGNVLGRHEGICGYTIGQRKGLGISFGKPMYVCEIKPETNEVVIGENEKLFKRRVFIENFNFMAFEEKDGEYRLKGKIRYSQKKADCTLKIKGGQAECVFDEPQRAVTPGQAAVFYDEDFVVGGGTIIK